MRINISNYPHLNGLQLANCFDVSQFQVDMLIGLNAYFDFVQGEMIKGGSGPFAIHSKLGSGKVDNGSGCNDANVVSQLILESFHPEETVEQENSKIKTALQEFGGRRRWAWKKRCKRRRTGNLT